MALGPNEAKTVLRVCSACAGDYEDPDRSAPDEDGEEPDLEPEPEDGTDGPADLTSQSFCARIRRGRQPLKSF
jgi:hypothetical protein